MKFSKQNYGAAQKLLNEIDNECDARIWSKDQKNETIYRTLKCAVRAWRFALANKYISEDGEVLVSTKAISLARDYEINGHKANWGGELHKQYVNNEDYRAQINAGSKIIEVEGINDLDAAKAIYKTYKGQFAPKEANRKPTYTELVLSGRYHE